MQLDGRVIVVTGAACGQGAQEARQLADEGAIVVATDVEPPRLTDGGRGRIVARVLDVTVGG